MSVLDWRSVPVRPTATDAARAVPGTGPGAEPGASRSAGSFAAALAAVRGEASVGAGDEPGAKEGLRDERPAPVGARREPPGGVPPRPGPFEDDDGVEPGAPLGPSPGTLPPSGGTPPTTGLVTVSGTNAEASMVSETSAGEVSAAEGGGAMEERMESETAAPVDHETIAPATTSAVVEAPPFASVPGVPPAPVRAGDTAPALAATAVGTLMDELRALDLPASGQWRFAMRGGPLGIDSIVLSRGEGGAWSLRLGGERARSGGSRPDVEALRGALRARGHEVGEIVLADDDGGSAG